MRVRVIVNRSGGTLKTSGETDDDTKARLSAAFEAAGVDADIHMLAPEALAGAFAAAAVASGLDAIVVGGGDGTINTAAGCLAESGRPLGILPLGTLNHLARDAGIPVALDQAVALIAAGHSRPIDLAEVNGRVFVNNSAVGLYPDMVRFRDDQQARTGRGKRIAMLSASIRALRSFRRRRLWISAPGIEAPIRTPLLFVGNNRYQVNLFALGRRQSLDQGELCVYAVRARSRAHLFWAGLRGIFGKLDQQRDFLTFYVTEVEIHSDRPALVLAIDGETATEATPLRYRIRPGALRLIVSTPAPAG